MRPLSIASLVLALSLSSGAAVAAEEAPAEAGAFAPTGPLAEARAEHTATLLPDGRVLVVGGADKHFILASAHAWDPETATFAPAGSAAEERRDHTATLLPDGRVLVIGGACCKWNAASVEIWDPAIESFAEAAPLVKGRVHGGHTATLLPDGRVLVIGGYSHTGHRLKAAEVWDPVTETFSPAGWMKKFRPHHTATLLADGRVLVVGGSAKRDNRWLAEAEVWDPETAAFAPGGALVTARAFHTATPLPGGRVLVVGGADVNGDLASAEVWDPATASFGPAGSLAKTRAGHTATLLPDGRVLIVGGFGDGGALASAEVWDPATDSIQSSQPPPEQDLMAPSMVTGTVSGPQTSGGTETGDDGVYRIEGVKYIQTWEASDPRLSGEEDYTGNWHYYHSDDFQVETNTRIVVNDEGRWVGTGTALAGAGMNAETAVLQGEGAYEGLTAYLVMDFNPDPGMFVGAIFPGEMPERLEPASD